MLTEVDCLPANLWRETMFSSNTKQYLPPVTTTAAVIAVGVTAVLSSDMSDVAIIGYLLGSIFAIYISMRIGTVWAEGDDE
jgi:hypothetical protein